MQQGLRQIVNGLETKGLLTHEFTVADTASPLGVSWDGVRHCTALSAKRYWRVAQAVRFALSRRAVPGWCWELLIGHLIFCGLIARDCLSAFHSIYAFIRKYYERRVLLWPSAREEIQHFTAALILMRADWRLL